MSTLASPPSTLTPAQQVKPSVCPLDCPDTCSLAITVADNKVVKVRGSDANPYTAGAICSKVSNSYPDFVHGKGRLTKPLLRSGPKGSGSFREISWEEALDRVYDGFSQALSKHGPESLLPFNYAGPHGQLAGGSMDRRFFYKLGATQLNRGPLCGGVRGAAYSSLFGTAPGMAPEQAKHADLIVVWGNNVTVSNLHLARVIKEARADGARLVVVDPKRTKIAEQADLHLQVTPGSDVVLALGLAAELERQGAFDQAFIKQWVYGAEVYMGKARHTTFEDVKDACGIGTFAFKTLVDWYKNAKNVAVNIGNGIERGKSGGSGLRAAMALQALTGNHGRLGAGVVAKPGLTFPWTGDKLQRPDLIPEGTRTFNIVDVGKLLLDETLDPPIAATMIYNHNPVATHPDQNRMRRALSREDLFVVGCDVVMTDSLLYADVILPAASHFEFADLYGSYGHSYLQRAEAVIPCVGESLPNTEIFRRLAARFGFTDPCFQDSDEDLINQAINSEDRRFGGTQASDLPLDKALFMSTTEEDEELILCKNLTPGTKSGKIELFSQDLEDRFGFGLPRYEPAQQDRPFVIISPSSSKRTNATFGNCPESQGAEVVEINPADAAARDISDGDSLRVFNDLGAVNLTAVLTTAVRPGVLYSPKGTWLNSSQTGQTVNALIPADLRTDIEDGACYHETFVEVERV
ncbi:molybdopterin-dependent oxidoreductase [Rhodovibrionaceae bacterium A322]